MGSLVAVHAALEFEVNLPRLQMAPVALLERFCFRRVAEMAARAGDGSVFASGRLYFFRLSGMTFCTASASVRVITITIRQEDFDGVFRPFRRGGPMIPPPGGKPLKGLINAVRTHMIGIMP
jgi:hypothetical protein